jgi:hypothetical protein
MAVAGGMVLPWWAWLFGSPQAVVFLGALGAAVSVIGIAVLVWGVRCPSCALRLVPWSLGNRPLSKWLEWLLVFEHCPRCGYPSATGGSQDDAT